MAYLPNEQEVRETTATDTNGGEGGPAISKVLIVLLFFAALGLLVAAGVVQFNNRERLTAVVPMQWSDGVIDETDPEVLRAWEKVRIAEEIATRVRQYHTYVDDNPELFGEDVGEMRRRVPTLVSRLARHELSIRDHQLEMGRGVTSREWDPPRRQMDHLRGRFVTNTYSFSVENVSREQAVQLALLLEDNHPWITVEELRIERSRDAPDDEKNVAWNVRYGLQWWEERAGATHVAADE